jgi:hypothetical protein
MTYVYSSERPAKFIRATLSHISKTLFSNSAAVLVKAAIKTEIPLIKTTEFLGLSSLLLLLNAVGHFEFSDILVHNKACFTQD